MWLFEITADIEGLRRYAEEVVRAGGVRAVWLVGSATHSQIPNDIDLVYVLDYAAPANADNDDPDLLQWIETHTRIEHDAYDSFYQAGNTFWHLTWGAGASMIRNDNYAHEQANKPKILLAKAGH